MLESLFDKAAGLPVNTDQFLRTVSFTEHLWWLPLTSGQLLLYLGHCQTSIMELIAKIVKVELSPSKKEFFYLLQ